MINYKIYFQTILFGFLILQKSSFANHLHGKQRCSPPLLALSTFEHTIISIHANATDEILGRGTLIDANWVLTTANCLKNIPLDGVRLMMGNEFVRKPKKMIDRNGIALIEMDEPVTVAPIEFATEDQLENANNCVVSGSQRYVNDSVALVYWNMVNVSKRLNDIGELWHLDDAICLGRTSSAWNTIENGTPLICNRHLYGILLTDKPMVFGSISNYEKWIERIIVNPATYDRAFVQNKDFYFPDMNINTAIVAENTNTLVNDDYDTDTTATDTEYTTERTETHETASERTETDGPTSEGTETDGPTSEGTETISEGTETISEGTETDGPTSDVTTQRVITIFPFIIPTITLFPRFNGPEGKMESGIMPVVASLNNNKEPRDALVAAEPLSRKVKETTETTPVNVTGLTAGMSAETFETEDGQFTVPVTTVTTAESSTENPSTPEPRTTAETTEEITFETEDFIPGSNSTAYENSLETEDASPIYVETPPTTTAKNDISTSPGTPHAKTTTAINTSTTTTSTTNTTPINITTTTTTTATNIPNINSTTTTIITNATTDEATRPAHSTYPETSTASGQTPQSDLHTPEITTHVTESTGSVVTESATTSSSRIMLPNALFITVLFFYRVLY